MYRIKSEDELLALQVEVSAYPKVYQEQDMVLAMVKHGYVVQRGFGPNHEGDGTVIVAHGSGAMGTHLVARAKAIMESYGVVITAFRVEACP
jgi:hypothetical protein